MANKLEKNNTTGIKDILANVKTIYSSPASLSILMDFERVLSELDLYAFANWKQGELVSGPVVEKYFVTATFMWPKKMMPDPRGGERLLGYDCEISYEKSHLEYPTKVTSREDYKPGGNMPKLVRSPVWLVTITMPKSLITEIHQGSIELEGEMIDIEEVESAYYDGSNEDEQQDTGDQHVDDHYSVPGELPK